MGQTPRLPAASSIHFTFDERKAASAAAFLLNLEGGHMKYLRLIKLLYLSERESLARFGRPIIGDRYVAMKYGPVLSRVLDLIKESENPGYEPSIWGKHIERDTKYTVRLISDPGPGALSEVEIEILKEASELCSRLSQWHISELTHALPEWRDPGDSRFEINPEAILQATGKSDEEIEEARQDAIERDYYDEIFGDRSS